MNCRTQTTLGLVLLLGFCVVHFASAASTTFVAQNGPVSVTYGDVYKRGELKIEPRDLTTLPPLPVGYAALNNKGYLITTTATVSGPHVGHFNAAFLSDEDAFKGLRIFHA